MNIINNKENNSQDKLPYCEFYTSDNFNNKLFNTKTHWGL